jgi:hypothetical protein
MMEGKKQAEAPCNHGGIKAQASWERLAEIKSGRTRFQQRLAATCKDLGR